MPIKNLVSVLILQKYKDRKFSDIVSIKQDDQPYIYLYHSGFHLEGPPGDLCKFPEGLNKFYN